MNISIIIPCYQNEDTLVKTLESVNKSSLTDFEVIVINDNPYTELTVSTDTCPFPLTIIQNHEHLGCAESRNKGARTAKGDILFFTDADVCLKPDTIKKLTAALDDSVAASIGSYTVDTPVKNACSAFKNIFHHYNHQNLDMYSPSFWTGCGAIYKKTFLELKGFDTAEEVSPIEDIDLGYRLTEAGYKIKIIKDAYVVHLKNYSFKKLIMSDLCFRAIPWTYIILKNKKIPPSSNTSSNYKLSLILTAVFASFNILNILQFSFGYTFAATLSLLGIGLLNLKFLNLTAKAYGHFFLIKAIPLLLLYFICCITGMAAGIINFYRKSK